MSEPMQLRAYYEIIMRYLGSDYHLFIGMFIVNGLLGIY
jgi:hypothetical protein